MVKTIKKQGAIFFFLKMILFAALVVFFYMRLTKINWTESTIQLQETAWLICSILLVPLNWFFEWKKWKLTLKHLEIETESSVQNTSFFAGIVTGMLTPNMLGNFIGRIYYFDRAKRVQLIVLTIMSNFAQFMVSILLGIISIILLQRIPLQMEIQYVLPILAGVGVCLMIFYFTFEQIFRFRKGKNRIYEVIRNMNERKLFRWKLLLLSLARHAVFSLQFLLVLASFGESITFENILWIWQVYLWVTLAPSLFLGKLGIRESISIWVLSVIGMNDIVVLFSSFIIWTLNLLLPTILSLSLVRRKAV